MNFMLYSFLPFLIIVAGGVVMMIGGFDGYSFDPRNGFQMAGAIVASVGGIMVLWRLIKQIGQWWK